MWPSAYSDVLRPLGAPVVTERSLPICLSGRGACGPVVTELSSGHSAVLWSLCRPLVATWSGGQCVVRVATEWQLRGPAVTVWYLWLLCGRCGHWAVLWSLCGPLFTGQSSGQCAVRWSLRGVVVSVWPCVVTAWQLLGPCGHCAVLWSPCGPVVTMRSLCGAVPLGGRVVTARSGSQCAVRVATAWSLGPLCCPVTAMRSCGHCEVLW